MEFRGIELGVMQVAAEPLVEVMLQRVNNTLVAFQNALEKYAKWIRIRNVCVHSVDFLQIWTESIVSLGGTKPSRYVCSEESFGEADVLFIEF